MTAAGYAVKHKDGHHNRYQIHARHPTTNPASQEPAIGEVLALPAGRPAIARVSTTMVCRPVARGRASGSSGAFARLGLSCARVAMRRFVRSKMQVAEQIKQAGRRRSVCGVFEDRTR